MLRRSFASLVLSQRSPAAAILSRSRPVVRTADPIKRGMQLTDFPRTIKVADNVYTYEDFHAGAGEVHDDQHVRRHQRRRAGGRRSGQRAPKRKGSSTRSRK